MEIKYDTEREGVSIFIPYKKGEYQGYDLTSTGKSHLIAKTSSFVTVEGCPDDLKVGLNLIKVIPKEPKKPARKSEEDDD